MSDPGRALDLEQVFSWWTGQSAAEKTATVLRVRAEMEADRRGKREVKAGDRFGKWTVLREAESRDINGKRLRQFECRCACGHEQPVLLTNLKSRKSTRCLTCARAALAKPGRERRPAPAAGERWGSWTVIAEAPPRCSGGRDSRMLLCRCDCGRERAVQLGDLTHGKSTRCRNCAGKRRREAVVSRES